MSQNDISIRLLAILRGRSVLRGDFTLASGKKSNVYVDARLTTLHAPAMPLIGQCILAKIAERGWRVDAVGGLTMGADPIVVAVARESLDHAGRPLDGFLIRKEPKGHGRGRFVEGLPSGAGLSAVIVEDTSTTGARRSKRSSELGNSASTSSGRSRWWIGKKAAGKRSRPSAASLTAYSRCGNCWRGVMLRSREGKLAGGDCSAALRFRRAFPGGAVDAADRPQRRHRRRPACAAGRRALPGPD